VNEPASDVKCDEGQEPGNQQNNEQRDQHNYPHRG
jgi:hypothetical protein